MLYARGDAFSGPADLLRADQILGRVVTVTYGGRTITTGSVFRRVPAIAWVAAAPVSQIILRLATLFKGAFGHEK